MMQQIKKANLCCRLFILSVIVFEISASKPYFPWMYYLPYGEVVTLKPLFRNNSEEIIIKSCKWTTPKGMDLIPGSYNYDLERYNLDKFKCELTIYNIQKDTNGIYHCTVNEIHISKAMLNVHGAPKNSLLEEYTPNLIAGFSTAGAIIALFAITCTVYHFRYKELPDNTNDETVQTNHVTFNGTEIKYYTNKSYEHDDEMVAVTNIDEDDISNVRF